MAKVEQFPDQSGENTNDHKNMPDDSLLIGSGSADTPGPEDFGDPDPEAPDLPRKRREREPDDGLSYAEKIRRHRIRVRVTWAVAILLILSAVILTAAFMSNRHFSRAEIIPVREFAAEEGAVCKNFDGNILQYGPNGATCADTNGRIKWSITYEMDQPILSMSGNVAAIADYGGRTIYVMNTSKQLCSIKTSLPIHKISASESGEVAAILDDANSTWIQLYSRTGDEIAYFVRSMEENGYPMDVAVSANGSVVCVSSLMMKDASVKSVLSFYNFGKAGKDYPQHKVVDFEYDNEVFPCVRFMGDKVCTAASDSRFVVFDTSGVEPKNSINNMLTENLQGIFYSDKYIGLLFTDLTREYLYRLDIYGKSGKKEGSVGFSMVFDDLQIAGNRIYINNAQAMQIYALDGREIFNGGFDRMVKTLIPSSGPGGLYAVSENEIDEIKLR